MPRETRRLNLSGHDPIEVLKRLLSTRPKHEELPAEPEQEQDQQDMGEPEH